jgi:hypothetical protein
MSVPVYEPRVTCMAYCYGGSVVLELDEYPDVTDPLAVVKYTDHVAALAEAEQRVRDSLMDSTPELTAYRKQQFNYGVAAAREAVAALPDWMGQKATGGSRIHRSAALAAIDALTERGAES